MVNVPLVGAFKLVANVSDEVAKEPTVSIATNARVEGGLSFFGVGMSFPEK
jgi:hypothetical protein